MTTAKHFKKHSVPIMKKFPGNVFSFKLLYVRSKTSSTGKAPKPLGKLSSLLMDKFKILNFGMEERDNGSSSMKLLAKFSISRLVKLAKPGGTAKKIHL